MKFCVQNAMKMTVLTESGIARRVFIDGKEFTMVQGLNIEYGINALPLVTVTFLADVKVKEKELVD